MAPRARFLPLGRRAAGFPPLLLLLQCHGLPPPPPPARAPRAPRLGRTRRALPHDARRAGVPPPPPRRRGPTRHRRPRL
uniref:Uncharacterized protein n=1 Tax=Arundo donax TaxID=35708 RepID=A0A0A9GQW0_ARUDO